MDITDYIPSGTICMLLDQKGMREGTSAPEKLYEEHVVFNCMDSISHI